MKNTLVNFILLVGVFASSSALACSYIFVPQEYISVLQVYGMEDEDLVFWEASSSIGFKGDNEYNVFSNANKLIVTRSGGKICAHNHDGTKECWDDRNRMIYLSGYLNYSWLKRTEIIYIQKNGGGLNQYKVKRKRVRATSEHNEQLMSAGWSACYDHT